MSVGPRTFVKGVRAVEHSAANEASFVVIGSDGVEHTFVLDRRTLGALIALLRMLEGRMDRAEGAPQAPDPSSGPHARRRPPTAGDEQHFSIAATEDGLLKVLAEDDEHRLLMRLGPQEARELQTMLHEVIATLAERHPRWRTS